MGNSPTNADKKEKSSSTEQEKPAQFSSVKQEMLFRVISRLIWLVVSLLVRTVRLEVQGEEEVNARQESGQPSIVVTWHGRTLIPVYRYGPRRWAAIISLSRDGEYQARIFRRFGWQIVRGSSGRGSIRALVGALRKLKEGATLAFTPDGPRGPSHTVHPGVLYLSQKSGCPIYPLGLSVYPRWVLPTWDSYQIPCPFSRACILYGQPLTVPSNATGAELEQIGEELASRICHLESEAERIVTARKSDHLTI